MTRKRKAIWLVLALWLASRLAWGGADVRVRGGAEVLLLNHGYHSGLAIERETLEKYASAVGQGWLRDFPDADWFEIGWGDRGFYFSVPTFTDVTFAIGARALLWPSESVLHVATGTGTAKQVFAGSEQIAFSLGDQDIRALITALESGSAGPVYLGRGLYLDSLFYSGSGQYHMFYTCNSWTAAVLRQANIGASPLFAQSTSGLFWELKLRYGAGP